MKNKLWQNPIWMTILYIAGMSYIFTELVPLFWNNEQRNWALYFPIVVLLLYVIIVALLAAVQYKGTVQVDANRVSLLPGIGSLVAGGYMLAETCRDAIAFLTKGQMPPPYIIQQNKVDAFFYDLVLVGGILGGLVLIILGIRWIVGQKASAPLILWGMIFPIIWCFGRLARFTVSYVSAIRNPVLFPTAIVFILNTLFFYFLGRQMYSYSKARSWKLAVVSGATAVMGISLSVSQMILPSIYPEFLSESILCTTLLDGCIGFFALCVCGSLFTKKAIACATRHQALVEEEDIDENSVPEENSLEFLQDEKEFDDSADGE